MAARAALWRGRCRGQVSHGTLVAAMQKIADWLKKLGMSEYAERFAENDIDASVLPELTDQDLKDLGISLGVLPQNLVRDSLLIEGPRGRVEALRITGF